MILEVFSELNDSIILCGHTLAISNMKKMLIPSEQEA